MARLAIGDEAPAFSLDSSLDEKVSLGQYRGDKNVVLFFFTLAWTPV